MFSKRKLLVVWCCLTVLCIGFVQTVCPFISQTQNGVYLSQVRGIWSKQVRRMCFLATTTLGLSWTNMLWSRLFRAVQKLYTVMMHKNHLVVTLQVWQQLRDHWWEEAVQFWLLLTLHHLVMRVNRAAMNPRHYLLPTVCLRYLWIQMAGPCFPFEAVHCWTDLNS